MIVSEALFAAEAVAAAAAFAAATTLGDTLLYVSDALFAAEDAAEAVADAAAFAPITAFFFASFAALTAAAHPVGLISDLGTTLTSVSPSKITLYFISVSVPAILLTITPFLPVTLCSNVFPFSNPPI